ncbi:2-amino-4-hydroxy-6-hydroxymethyldihydropteridine diphosphokinase [Nocardia bovistercoris]|uniref:2-amino-4-hydroxy-6-hydroxymethyldihydropteridine diphosphokinase n=1 Tax=Nocardia bovistercoris TaxID=2785916 RepID=A0A931IJ58_9NOCA|nr:2-amino-4-hydroxy-6-hydroxymethyldihydropteridine diphosphokinase [Nocardia bovistercoris]MBH0781291.1 2-amino-4-hydroxy-6-hydroxymethyldihydropteridine diphosphokinase [Nocardia bovistercoris]
MSRAVLSIGSNLGDRLGYLRGVVDGFGDRVLAVSSVYTTAPWGGVDQDDYLNAVLLVEDPAFGCRDWLAAGQDLERAADRVRTVRWGARTLDVDVIACADERGEVRSDDPELTVPHPRAHERAFVLVPWLEVEPAAVLEADGVTRALADWIAALPADERAEVRRTELALVGERS